MPEVPAAPVPLLEVVPLRDDLLLSFVGEGVLCVDEVPGFEFEDVVPELIPALPPIEDELPVPADEAPVPDDDMPVLELDELSSVEPLLGDAELGDLDDEEDVPPDGAL
jgi:hypothetical protein